MISSLLIGIGTALAVFAILAKTRAGEAKKAQKWEKGEIIRQLLALSEREDRASVIASPPARNLRPTFTPATRGDPPKGTFLQHNSKRTYSHRSPTPPISPRPSQTDAEIQEEIRQRAFELYQERGGVEGNPTDDWLQAKKEVLSHKPKAGRTSC